MHRASIHNFQIKKLATFQRKVAIRITKAFHTISHTSVLEIANLTPLDLRIQEQASIENYRLLRSPSDININIDLPINYLDQPHPSVLSTIEFDLINNEEEANAIGNKGELVIYTDGSKIDNGTGAAYYISPQNYRMCKLGPKCSVFQSELIAIKMAIEHATENRHQGNFHIMSDSRSALQSIKQMGSTNRTVHEIHKLLRQVQDSGAIAKFHWVKAHCGISGNESADHYAKEAATSNNELTFNKIPISHFKKTIKENTKHQWNQRYQNSHTGEWTRKLLPSIQEVEKWAINSKITPTTTQFISNHCRSRQYLHRFTIIDNNSCPCDGHTTQTMEHLYLNCPMLACERATFSSYCNQLGVNQMDIAKIAKSDIFIDFEEFILKIFKLIQSN